MIVIIIRILYTIRIIVYNIIYELYFETYSWMINKVCGK